MDADDELREIYARWTTDDLLSLREEYQRDRLAAQRYHDHDTAVFCAHRLTLIEQELNRRL